LDKREDGDSLDAVCELALSAGWCQSIDEFWSAEPNVDEERGFTLPRLEALQAAHRLRATTERYKLAEVIALAFHEPSKLQEKYEQATALLASEHPLGAETESWYTPPELAEKE
jgi:hypothetical protein